jgi:ATP-dependent Lhr-like helicase
LPIFHPAVAQWFRRRFAAPSRAQQLGWPVIAAAARPPGHDVLLCAPTGSGKTLAAFMWAINRLIVEAQAGELRDQVSVLYVSPLKALANDIRLNLEEPLHGVREVAAEMGMTLAPIRAGLRTGDTPANERTAMLRRPPHILVTTPESLFILLTSARFREKLRAVRYIIVDELHAVAGDKRGAHLTLTLERLERTVRAHGAPRPVRIGLSATLNPIETLAAFLAGADVAPDGARTPRPVRIVRADDKPRELDLAVIAPGPELGALATHPHWDAMYDTVATLIREHRTTLVFTLSRRWAERIALALQKRLGADAVMAHHGSLARAERLAAEQRLKRGELKAIVATASLELGIDVGAVDLVCQIDSPKSISAAIQRIGRSGHSLGATPKGRFFALTIDDLIECAAAVRAIRSGHLDEVEVPLNPLDVAAQQIVAIATDEDDIAEDELLRLLRSSHSFGTLEPVTMRRLIEEMAAQLPDRIQGAAPKIFYDRVARRVRPRRGARLSAITSGGTIPEAGNYDVVIASEGRKIGDVEEDFAQESARGDVFSLGSMPWKILGISKNRLLVEPAPGMTPSLPFWQTEAAGRSPAMSTEVSTLRREVAAFFSDPATSEHPSTSRASGDPLLSEHLSLSRERSANANEVGGTPDEGISPSSASIREQAAARWMVSECALDQPAAAQAVAWIRRGLAALGVIPDEKHIVVERFFDGLGGTQIVIHSPFGIRFNRGLGLAIRKRLCQSFDFEIQASAIDDAVLLALNSRHSFPLEDILTTVNSRTARPTLVQAMLDAPMFEVRFRHVATRALAIMRSMRGRKVPAWIQRLRTQELITALFPRRNACFENRPPAIEIPSHYIVGETVRECLEESADADRMDAVLRGLENGAIAARFVDAVPPSVFAHRILLAWDYSFLDDGERANRRSRTVTMNRAMAEDVFREEDLSSMISAHAVERVAAEIGGYAPGSTPRNEDELYELVRTHGSIRVTALERQIGGETPALALALERAGRFIRVQVAPASPEALIAAEDLPLFAAAYPEANVAPPFPAQSNASLTPDAMPTAQPDAARITLDEAKPITQEDARLELVRRALATTVPTTALNIAARLALAPDGIARILATLEAAGVVFRGYFTTARPLEMANPHRDAFRVANGVAISPEASEQWCDRYVLERIHRQTLNRLRAEVEPCADHDFAAFRLRWMQVGSGLPANSEAVGAVLEQLSGLAFDPAFWERAILPARIHGYRPEHLDLLCLSGDLRWIATPGGDDSASGESATLDLPTDVAFLPRRKRFQTKANAAPADQRSVAVLRCLVAHGAQYLDQVADRAGLSERYTLAALWRLAANGLASNDSFAPLRLLSSDPDAARAITDSPRAANGSAASSFKHDAALRARLKSSLSGRWSAIENSLAGEADARSSGTAGDAAAFDEVREVATLLLARNGILTREMLALESLPVTWQTLSFALRRMEYAGTIRRGYFVRALSGEQYALPEALEMLRAARTAANEPPVAISATDPANPYGVLLPGCGVTREAANLIVLCAGRFVLGLAARALIGGAALDDDSFAAALAALMTLRPKLTIESIDGVPALDSERVPAMAAMRFHSDGRALVFDGLPGPAPARAQKTLISSETS